MAFAGDRAIAVSVLDHLVESGTSPLALLVPDPGQASHADALERRCPSLGPDRVLRGPAFRQPAGVTLLRSLRLDFLVSVHFPYLVPEDVLGLPRHGCLNLHPSYLPYNRGWHTVTWALLEGAPVGATLHYMDAGVDTGPIVLQRELEVGPEDTAATLYPRLFALEVDVFKEGWPLALGGRGERREQARGSGSSHRRTDLFDPAVQRIDLEAPQAPGDLLLRLRALTTNRPEEAAYFEVEGRRFRVQVSITPDD